MKTILITFGVFVFNLSQAQDFTSIQDSTQEIFPTYYIAYDKAGNRIRRYFEIIVESSKTLKSNKSEINQKNKNVDFISNIKIYPNPTDGNINISSNGIYQSIEKLVVIFDEKGTKVIQNNSNDENIKIDLSQWADGSYFVKIKSGELSNEWKIIKKSR